MSQPKSGKHAYLKECGWSYIGAGYWRRPGVVEHIAVCDGYLDDDMVCKDCGVDVGWEGTLDTAAAWSWVKSMDRAIEAELAGRESDGLHTVR